MWNKVLTPEGRIKRDVKQYLRVKGWKVIHIQQGALSEPGITDMIAVKNGTVVWVEIKVPAGARTATGKISKGTNLSKDQVAFRDDLIAHGGIHITARSIDDIIRAGY